MKKLEGSLQPIDDQDAFDSYFECITTCYGLSGEDIECVTKCAAVHLDDSLETE